MASSSSEDDMPLMKRKKQVKTGTEASLLLILSAYDLPKKKKKKKLTLLRTLEHNGRSYSPRSAEQTPDPTQARSKSVIGDDESSDEEMPLAKRANSKANGKHIKNEDSSDDDNVPLVSHWKASLCVSSIQRYTLTRQQKKP
jgi:hypothetical protein